ncbi:MAG TPA: GntR family transcriptional regulator [Chthoniobacterales bacterium]
MVKNPANSRSLAEKAYEHILDRLLKREWLPGQILNRREVAQQLKVSIAPVLEAMVRLEAEGLLTSLPRKGTQVRLVRPEETADHMTVREAIECQAARYYCGNPVLKDEKNLRQLAEAIDNADENSIQIWKKEIAFHGRLVELSGSDALLLAFRQAIHLGTLCTVNLFADLHPNNPEGNHVSLVERLKTKDPDAAARYIREHIRGGKQQLFVGANGFTG